LNVTIKFSSISGSGNLVVASGIASTGVSEQL
jgi:hypothetical protein